MKEMVNIYARILNQHIFNYQTTFSARSDKQGENEQISDEDESYIGSKFNHS